MIAKLKSFMIQIGDKEKSIFITFFVFILSLSSFGQQLPLHSQYVYNPLVINPAFVGVSANSNIHFTTRSQWIGFSDGIRTISLSGNYNLTENHGVGGILFKDNTGAISITGIELDYSFKFPVFNNYSMSLGLGLLPYQYLYDANQVIFNDENDQTLAISEQTMGVDANIGLFIYSDFMFAGLSALNMIQSKNLTSVDENNPNQLVRHYYALFGYNYVNQASKVGLEQTILMRSTSYSGLQFDFNIKSTFNESFFLLCGYRTNKEILAGFGIKYGRWGFIYNIDINYGEIGDYSNASHELGLVFYLNNNKVFDWGNDLNIQYQ